MVTERLVPVQGLHQSLFSGVLPHSGPCEASTVSLKHGERKTTFYVDKTPSGSLTIKVLESVPECQGSGTVTPSFVTLKPELGLQPLRSKINLREVQRGTVSPV